MTAFLSASLRHSPRSWQWFRTMVSHKERRGPDNKTVATSDGEEHVAENGGRGVEEKRSPSEESELGQLGHS